jgi:hypothetical protein
VAAGSLVVAGAVVAESVAAGAAVAVAAAAEAGGNGVDSDIQTNFPWVRLGDGLLPAGPLFGFG